MNNKRSQVKKRKAAERNKRQAARRNRSHVCGGCRACCYVFELPGKETNTWCPHITPKGCGIYRERPNLCSGYYCGWLQAKAHARKLATRQKWNHHYRS